MATPREGPNPLRPYYIPPSIGPTSDASTSHNAASTRGTGAGSKPSISSSARDIFSDLDYTDYLSDGSPSAADMTKSLLDQALWKYTSVLIAQPFDVAKTILQCHVGPAANGAVAAAMPKKRPLYRERVYDELDDSDPDEPAYFTSSTPTSRMTPRSRRDVWSGDDATSSPAPASRLPHRITLTRPSSLIDALSQVWAKEGAWGVWKGANTTFIYSVLLKTMESWTRSLLAALFNVPEPGLLAGVIDILDSPYPVATLGVAVAAAGIAGVILAPLDIVRTQLILTPTTHTPRGFIPALRSLPSLACPTDLLPITLLHSTLSPLLTTSTPLILRSRFSVDPLLTPNTHSALTFLTATAELFLRLPLETVLRRGQINKVLATNPKIDTIVEVGPYHGVLGTMWTIVREEGSRGDGPLVTGVSAMSRAKKTGGGVKKGQGIEGLWRGWRVGMWGLVGMWSAAAMGGAGKGGEF